MRLSHRAVAQRGALPLLLCILLAPAVQADLIVPSGGSMSLASGTLDLGCSDIVVGGTLQINSGIVTNVRNVTIQSGGTIDGGSGSITLAGNWSNSGNFVPGTSTVSFVDNAACATASTITGNSTFYNLSLVSMTGKVYAFQSGAIETVIKKLAINGTAGASIKIVSTTPGIASFLSLAPGGTQNIQHVGVTDNLAIGQPLAPGQSNEGGGGDVRGWFGIALIDASAPVLDTRNLLLLVLMLGVGGMTALARALRKSQSLIGR